MKIDIPAFKNGAPIPGDHCFSVPADIGHISYSSNLNPQILWSDVPHNTRSFALLVVDPDVPSVGDLVNQEGKTVPADLPRVEFYHFVLVDIPADLRELPEGCDSNAITAKGKPIGQTKYGVRGVNDYTSWFEGDPEMGGNYGGYDGPCPPWNDEIPHRYFFNLYALDVETLGLAGAFTGVDALRAMEGHVLAKATHFGTYTQNPDLI